MKITVIGTGYVGLDSGARLADLGNDVLCLSLKYCGVGRGNMQAVTEVVGHNLETNSST